MSGPDDKPLLVLSRQGKGRVAQLLSDQGWLWARGFEGGGPQTELLRRLAHWLMKEPDLEEEALDGKQQGNDLVIERRTMADSGRPGDGDAALRQDRDGARCARFRPAASRARCRSPRRAFTA